ncbi:MAG: hypothetical protein WAZ19_11160 [Anaerolineae bacterium]
MVCGPELRTVLGDPGVGGAAGCGGEGGVGFVGAVAHEEYGGEGSGVG